MLTTEGPLLGLVAAELFGEGGAEAAGANSSTTREEDPGHDASQVSASEQRAADLVDDPSPNGGGILIDADEFPSGGRSGPNGGGDGLNSGEESPESGREGPTNGEDPNNSDCSHNGKGASGGEKEGFTDRGDPEGGEATPPEADTAENMVAVRGGVEEEAGGEKQGATNPYRRALLSCVMWRRQQGGAGAQVRLGAIAVLRSAVKNPSAAAEVVLGGPAADGSVAAGGALPSSLTHGPEAIAVLDGLTGSVSPARVVGEAIVDTADGGASSSGQERQELVSVASQASVLDFMLPDEERERPTALLSGASLGSAADAGAEPSVLDFMLPGSASPPAVPPRSAASPPLTAVAPPRRKSYHIAAMLPRSSSPPEDPPPRRKSYDITGLQDTGSGGRVGPNDGFGPRPSKYLPRLERLWNGGGLLFSERGRGGDGGGGRSGGGGAGGIAGAGAAGSGTGGSDSFGCGGASSGSRQRSDCFEQASGGWRGN